MVDGSGLIIDTHAHYLKMATRDGGTPGSGVDRAIKAHGRADLPAEELLEILDESGVSKLLQVTSAAAGYDNSYSISAAEAHPDRVRVIARIDVTSPQAAAHLRELMSDPP